MKALILMVVFGIGLTMAAFPCCPDDNIILPKGYCFNSTTRINRNCTNGHFLLKDIILQGDALSTQDSPNFIFAQNPKDYCVGAMYRNISEKQMGTIPVAVVCFQPGTTTRLREIEISGTLSLVSVIFLFLTFGVYVFLPQLRDLQGLCYMCMCVSMAFGMLSLGILQLSPGFRGELCTFTGFIIYFWMMATFFWMNVVCLNVYRTVVDASYLKRTERKQYFMYSCYAWGGTFLFLVVTLITNFVEGDHWNPGIGSNSCWFKGPMETWIFFYGPIAVLIAGNILLFILSSVHMWQHTKKYEVSKLRNLRHRFLLSLKLLLVMGISWIFEIVSFAHGESHIMWRIMDTFNCLQGVVIFILLVLLRKRAMAGLAADGCCVPVTRALANKLSPDDDTEDKQGLTDDHTEVRLN